mmetsp:Transcript_22436/g.42947  ORF Transcript_22436/g.42947 Transcript_22436/m.42947 type:complete len:607 (+) Transcript_22436:61-1881(+)
MIFAAAVALLQVALVGAASEWVYAYAGEPVANEVAQEATWGGLCTTGKEQSPINVVTSATVKTVNPVIETHFDTDVSYVKNTGHGFQLFETSPANHSYNATSAGISEVDNIGGSKGYSFIGGAKFNFYQVHWHSPSENTVDGTSFPLEAHFVHQLDDKALHGGYHRLAVIGLLYDLSTECNKVLDKFWDVFPKAKGVAPYAGDALNLNAKLNDELKSGYYHWYGSLTTPPCTEGVSWNLLKRRQKVCQQQLDHIKTALGTTQKGINFNNRVPMPLNHRIVTETASGAPVKPVNNIVLEGTAKWLYANKGETKANASVQESTWGGLCKTGHEQSPINVVTASTQKVVGQKPIITHMSTRASYVKNTGHGFQVFETSPKSHKYDKAAAANKYVSVDDASGSAKGYSMINGEKFNFYQVHWHTPSENTVNGQSFPLEAHFVHQLDDAALHGTYHRLAVIGLLYELGTDDECNEFLDKFWNTFPTLKGVTEYTGDDFDMNTKLTAELSHGYYHWYGSLTTPPCTEGVSWNLLKKTEKVCQGQVDRLKAALAATQDGIAFNNRVTMPLNHRIVTNPQKDCHKIHAASAFQHMPLSGFSIILLAAQLAFNLV